MSGVKASYTDAGSSSLGSTMGSLGRSLRRRSRISERYAPVVIEELGPERAAAAFADACRRDASDLYSRGQSEGARLCESAAAVFDLAAEALAPIVSEGWQLAFSGEPGVDLKRPPRAADERDIFDWLAEHRPRAWAAAVLSANMKGASE